MTASVGREVHRNRLSAAALKGAVRCAETEDAGGENFGDLGEAVGGGQQLKSCRQRIFLLTRTFPQINR